MTVNFPIFQVYPVEKQTLALQGFIKITDGKGEKDSCLHCDGCEEKQETQRIAIVIYFWYSNTEAS